MVTIHSSAKFENIEMSFHSQIEVNATIEQILTNKNKATNLALAELKKKCEAVFKLDFSTMCFFEVYVFEPQEEGQESKEINLFKKEKEK